MYNGWLHTVFVTGTICFSVDGCTDLHDQLLSAGTCFFAITPRTVFHLKVLSTAAFIGLGLLCNAVSVSGRKLFHATLISSARRNSALRSFSSRRVGLFRGYSSHVARRGLHHIQLRYERTGGLHGAHALGLGKTVLQSIAVGSSTRLTPLVASRNVVRLVPPRRFENVCRFGYFSSSSLSRLPEARSITKGRFAGCGTSLAMGVAGDLRDSGRQLDLGRRALGSERAGAGRGVRAKASNPSESNEAVSSSWNSPRFEERVDSEESSSTDSSVTVTIQGTDASGREPRTILIAVFVETLVWSTSKQRSGSTKR
ncbi:hypothetical protein GQ600_3161 [Phytophthora cactorum]|nr:hypothetical protein GQ600_3161 [Phytophthora cactorum]